MKNVLILTLFLAFQVEADSSALTREFKTLVTQAQLGTVMEQTYCYSKDGVIEGYQPHKIQRIASVSKLLSTLFASETMDLNQTFLTKIYIGKDSLHIEGGKDPYFEEEKLLMLFQALNDLGYTRFKRVTLSSDFLFYDLTMIEYKKVTPEQTRSRLAFYLDFKNIAAVRAKWQSVRQFAYDEGVELEYKAPILSSREVMISDVNPLLNENPVIYEHRSKPLHSLLKTMNVQSKNYIADNVYEAASTIKSFSTLMAENNIDLTSFRIYTGSGLPVIMNQVRKDNLASCSMILKIMVLLSKSLKKHLLQMSDVVAINGGKDHGSLRNRFMNYPKIHESVLSKTGTLRNTSALAGVLMNGMETPFAILNHTTNTSSARIFQDRFVSRMFDYLGLAVPLDYTEMSIFPWDGSDFLKNNNDGEVALRK